ncbi:CDGSH iron-sulfur domain-containing protein [Acidiferrobacter sp.]|uniref:CDGSH iron-sulfur domain-containing protein n=1 Tax=Acidiferrobacter sp. TaxID=1872107 RepID=UPI0026298003|nr:CDGSH iron-sulfur domain-containing protein [Acidiferrobacter sp.]
MTKITVKANGPYLVTGADVVDETGASFPVEAGKPIALCRCGASHKKPFCDGSHIKIGFKAAEGAAAAKK